MSAKRTLRLDERLQTTTRTPEESVVDDDAVDDDDVEFSLV